MTVPYNSVIGGLTWYISELSIYNLESYTYNDVLLVSLFYQIPNSKNLNTKHFCDPSSLVGFEITFCQLS